MKIWIKLTKHFQGGSHETYFHVDETVVDSNEKQEEFSSEWGENSGGGLNYGYRIYFEKVYSPSSEWLKKQIQGSKMNIKYIREEKVLTKKRRIEIEREKIDLYNSLIKK